MTKEERSEYNKNYKKSHREEILRYHRKYFADHKKEFKKNNHDYYIHTKDNVLAKNREWRMKNSEYIRQKRPDYRLKYLFGITSDDYNRMFDSQKGCCSICEKHQSELKTRLCVDHNHQTGKIRSLLCGNCNRGIGIFGENPEVMERAIRYLKAHNNIKKSPTEI